MFTSLMSLTMTGDALAFAVVEDVVHQRGLAGAKEAGKYGDGQNGPFQELSHGNPSERICKVGGAGCERRAGLEKAGGLTIGGRALRRDVALASWLEGATHRSMAADHEQDALVLPHPGQVLRALRPRYVEPVRGSGDVSIRMFSLFPCDTARPEMGPDSLVPFILPPARPASPRPLAMPRIRPPVGAPCETCSRRCSPWQGFRWPRRRARAARPESPTERCRR